MKLRLYDTDRKLEARDQVLVFVRGLSGMQLDKEQLRCCRDVGDRVGEFLQACKLIVARASIIAGSETHLAQWLGDEEKSARVRSKPQLLTKTAAATFRQVCVPPANVVKHGLACNTQPFGRKTIRDHLNARSLIHDADHIRQGIEALRKCKSRHIVAPVIEDRHAWNAKLPRGDKEVAFPVHSIDGRGGANQAWPFFLQPCTVRQRSKRELSSSLSKTRPSRWNKSAACR